MFIFGKYWRMLVPLLSIFLGLFPFNKFIKNSKTALNLQRSLFIVLGLLYLLIIYFYGI